MARLPWLIGALRALIQIKAIGGSHRSFFSIDQNWGFAMPTETAIVVAGIALVFAVFAVALAWADFYTRNYRAPGA